MEFYTKAVQNLRSDLNLSINHSFEPKMASWAFMESTSNHLYPESPDPVEFTSQGASPNPEEPSPNPSFGAPTQSYDPYQTSSINCYLKDWVSLFASSPCESNDESGFNHGCESMGFLTFLSSNPLEPPMNQPEIAQKINFQTHGSALADSLEDVPNLGFVENEHHKQAKGRKNKSNVQTKRKIIEGQWEKVIVKGQWSREEDRLLVQLVKQHGDTNWSRIAEKFSSRIGKQCRERWHNYLRPNITKDAWSEEEDKLLIALHKQLGNKWSEIARRMPRRSENTIKNHWNATKRRRFSSGTRNRGKGKYHSLLKDYINSITSSFSSDDQVNIQVNEFRAGQTSPVAGTSISPLQQPERSVFDPQLHQPMISFFSHVNAPSSSSGGLVLNGRNFDFHQERF